jgi:hypothetical protein
MEDMHTHRTPWNRPQGRHVPHAPHRIPLLPVGVVVAAANNLVFCSHKSFSNLFCPWKRPLKVSTYFCTVARTLSLSQSLSVSPLGRTQLSLLGAKKRTSTVLESASGTPSELRLVCAYP